MAKESQNIIEAPEALNTKPSTPDPALVAEMNFNRDAFAWRDPGEEEIDSRSDGTETIFTVPIDVQRDTVKRNGVVYDNYAVSCAFPTGKKDAEGNPIFLEIDMKLVPTETRTPVLYNLLRLIYGDAKVKPLSIVRVVRYDRDNKEILSYSARIIDKDDVAGEIFCDLRPQSTGDKVMFSNLVKALIKRDLIK